MFVALLKRYCPAGIFALLLLLFSHVAIAQEKSEWAGYGAEVSYIGGNIFKHSAKFTGPIPSYSSAIDINLLQQTAGTKDWQQRRHYPLVGLGVTYTNYGMDSVYGRCVGIYPVLQLPIVTGKKVEWTLKLGLGIGFVTTFYQRYPNWNTVNNAVGSHMNNFTMFATDLRYKIDNKWAVGLGGNFSHISDGAWRQPNLGVNMFGGHVALRYFPYGDSPERIKKDLPKLKNRWLLQARLGFSANESIAPNGPTYPVYTTSVFASKRYASRNKAYAGIDYSYHVAVEAFLKNNEIYPGEEKKHSWKSAAFIGNEFLMGRFGLILQLGFYMKQATLRQGWYYQKLGYNFYLIRNEKGALKELSIYTTLKTHKVQAEFIEFGMGLGF
jgi:hypothetical protein